MDLGRMCMRSQDIVTNASFFLPTFIAADAVCCWGVRFTCTALTPSYIHIINRLTVFAIFIRIYSWCSQFVCM